MSWGLACAFVLVVSLGLAGSGTAGMSAASRIVFSARPDARGAIGWQLFVVNADGSGLRRLTRFDGDVEPSWSPDGSYVVFERNTGYGCDLGACFQIWRVNADGAAARRLTPPSIRAQAPAFAPTGEQIAYVQWGAVRSDTASLPLDIWVMDANGRNRRRLTRAREEDEDPAWSPDGRGIVFSSNRDGNYELYVMNADGSGQKRLTRTPAAQELWPAWSPDGKRIAFTRRSSPARNLLPVDAIVVSKADGSGQRTIKRGAKMPAWSPEGRQIAYMKDTTNTTGIIGDGELWLMRPDGTDAHRVIDGPYSEPDSPDWTTGNRR